MAGFVSAVHGAVLAEGAGGRAASLVPSMQTAGRLFVFHYVAPPHFAGPPLQRRADADLTFYVVEGTLTVHVEERHDITTGQAVFIPRGTAYGFANATDSPTTFIGVVTPAGQLEQMLTEIGRYVTESRGQADPQRIAEIHTRHGAEIIGPPILTGQQG